MALLVILEALLMGIFATLFMDAVAGFMVKRNAVNPFLKPELIGRWFLYMFRGKFLHQDIEKTPPLKNEKSWCFISHYLIGIILSGGYLILQIFVPTINEQKWMSLLYGILTVVFPWFWLLPSTGFGFIASKSQYRTDIIKMNLVNHFAFGLGLLIWVVLFHNLFI